MMLFCLPSLAKLAPDDDLVVHGIPSKKTQLNLGGHSTISDSSLENLELSDKTFNILIISF